MTRPDGFRFAARVRAAGYAGQVPENAPFETPEPAEDADPASGDRWPTLAQAFAAHRYPIENLPFVQRLVDAIGIDHYEGIQSRTYIKAIRSGEGHWLHIHSGYTGGLASESEILDTVGDVDRDSWWNGREWWVAHPINRIRGGGSSSRRANARPAAFCPSCSMQLPASGVCDSCAG